jgi:hypothetical protein
VPYINAQGATGKISGVAVTGTAASGQVPVATSGTAGAWAFPPDFRIGYDQITGTVNIASTTEATGTTIISAAAHTFDGTLVRCEFFCSLIQSGTTAASQTVVSLFEGATQITRLAFIQTPAAAVMGVPIFASFYFTPTAASHTYTITAFSTNVTGTPAISAGAGGTATNPPAYVAFYKA